MPGTSLSGKEDDSVKTCVDALFSLLAGAAISLGGTVFLSLDNKVLGALFFCVGLFMVCNLGFLLFTGKVCDLPSRPPAYLGFLVLVWAGNLVGAELTALAVNATRVGPALAEKAAGLCLAKTEDSLLSLFLLGLLCNVLIYLAVESYKNGTGEVGRYLGLVLGVSVFILCGFEHCVADMFYFALAGWWSPRTLLCLLVITAGNAVGGVLIPLCRMLRARCPADR